MVLSCFPLIYMIILTMIQAYVIFHHYALWDRRKGALIALCIAFAATYVPAIAVGWGTVRQYQSESDDSSMGLFHSHEGFQKPSCIFKILTHASLLIKTILQEECMDLSYVIIKLSRYTLLIVNTIEGGIRRPSCNYCYLKFIR